MRFFGSTWALLGASVLVASVACTTTTASSGGGCPCTVGNGGVHATIGCGQSTCMTLNGTVTGYRCTEDGAVEDMSACTSSSGSSSGAGAGSDAGRCVPRVCGAPGGPECGAADNGCGGKLDCPVCNVEHECSEASHCLEIPQNVIVYGDYEGGTFTIDVDQDLPALAIGLVSYRPMHVTITGAFAGNVVAVYHAGYDAGSSVAGVDARLFTDSHLPNATVDAGAPYRMIVEEEPSGGNPPAQVNAFFVDRFGGGAVKFNECRRGHDGTTMSVSGGGSCPG